MKTIISILVLTQAALAHASVTDQFSCTLKTKEGKGTHVVVQDLASPDERFAGVNKYKSELIANFGNIAVDLPSLKLETEEQNQPIEGWRDDNPSGRSGWGGTSFYTAKEGAKSYVVVLKALRAQEGQAIRDYDFYLLSGENVEDINQMKPLIEKASLRCLGQ